MRRVERVVQITQGAGWVMRGGALPGEAEQRPFCIVDGETRRRVEGRREGKGVDFGMIV